MRYILREIFLFFLILVFNVISVMCVFSRFCGAIKFYCVGTKMVLVLQEVKIKGEKICRLDKTAYLCPAF